MPTKKINGFDVDVTSEGYLTDPSQWSEKIALAIAKEEDIAELTDAHWVVIKFLQNEFKGNGTLPSLRRMKKTGGIPTKELYQLFPDGPLKKSAKIAGLPKPESCV